MSDCLFCAIVAGDVPADVVYSDDVALAFRDLNPQAPTHVLVIPRLHYPNAGAAGAADAALGGALLAVAAKVAEQEGVSDGYRIVANTGAAAGQSVFHAHLHVLGGRPMAWPPG